VSFDPGTTGSCVAIGNHAANISVSEDRYNHKVIDSKLIFEITENYVSSNGKIPENLYKYGTSARTLFGSNRVASFQSIKKLLGFKDHKEIIFKNNYTLRLSGKDLSSLLVNGLYKELIYFVQKINNPEFIHNGVFNPQRAVIAIPNNFTISKIQDMVDCLGYLKQFKEVRYVYEAEAVLFYYLSNYSRFNNGNNQFKDENILVFDMGGATINATIVSASKSEENQKPVYYIDFLGKIGYGIGGDTIDYCILKFIKTFSREYPQFKAINFSTDNKKALVEAARSIKLNIVDYFEKGFDTLITTRQLNDYLKPLIGAIEYSEESDFYMQFKKNAKGKYSIFNHPDFKDLIYNNVIDAVNEVVDLSNSCKIDKVIFSGRSTFFPFIKETVERQLELKSSSPVKVTLEIEESKTAVAQGACWYGINKNSIRLNNLKTNASFGFKQTLSADTTDVKFIELVGMGNSFNESDSKIDEIIGTKNISSDFSFDGDKVNFYQVMGKNANQILANNQKHKFSKIASIRIPNTTEAIQIVVKEDDDIECKVKLVSERVLDGKGVVSDQEIADANEEHYTWIIN
jgi:molecular chaperone DnaK (HSP70)